ncbi:MAG: hypothetical protein IJX39_01835 [Clostridia bacterium]|nr:hypothetical protein [Clostridia bacterium]
MYYYFRPGKMWYDTDGKPIQAHGGSILFADKKFWWYGENKEGITGRAQGEKCQFQHHGVRCYSSVDLYNWKDEGMIVPESDDENDPFYPSTVVERPHILYNKKQRNMFFGQKIPKTVIKTANLRSVREIRFTRLNILEMRTQIPTA